MSDIKNIMKNGIIKDNPVTIQILGICSALAVTNLMLNSFVMGMGLIFVTAFSELTISILRKYTPKHIRMVIQTFIISSYVIILDIFLKAYYPSISESLGPYVGLIITNCIIMGRCEAYAQQSSPLLSFVDGIAYGSGYSLILLLIAFIRELLGFGTVFGIEILGSWFVKWTLMVMPPSAFFVLAIIIWISKNKKDDQKGGIKSA